MESSKYSFKNIYFPFIGKNGRECEKEEVGRISSTYWLTHCPQKLKLGQCEVRSLELSPGLCGRGRGLNTEPASTFPGVHCRKLSWKRSQDLNPGAVIWATGVPCEFLSY